MDGQRSCPQCGRPMQPDAKACYFCGFRPGLDAVGGGPAVPPTPYDQPARGRSNQGLIIGCIITAVVVIVVLPIIGILFAIALPNTTKVRSKAKEAEVKQNLHAIQLAIERYGVDYGGEYPALLYGGDSLCNIGTVNFYSPGGRSGAAYWGRPLSHPFDRFLTESEGWDYHDLSWQQLTGANPHSAFGDPLQYEGYLPRYPRNPFNVQGAQRRFSIDVLGEPGNTAWGCYGGREGDLMFNLGPFGELPQLLLDADGNQENRLDLPGQFYYHPRFRDGMSGAGHLRAAQQACPGSWVPMGAEAPCAGMLDDSKHVLGDQVDGYDLLAFGSPGTTGLDLDNSVGAKATANLFRTGYLTQGQERNPWVGPNAPEGDYGASVTDFDERPYSDNVPDFYIIHLGSGP